MRYLSVANTALRRPANDLHVVLDAFDTTIYCPWQEIRRDAARAAKIPFGALATGYRRTQKARNTGAYVSEIDEMRAVLREGGLSLGLAAQLTEDTATRAQRRSRVYDDVFEFVGWCRDYGIAVSLLSNCSPSAQPSLTTTIEPGIFDRLTLSFKVGFRKPQIGAYKTAAGDCPRGVTLFVDDNPEFCKGASEAGFAALQITRSQVDQRYKQDSAFSQVRSFKEVRAHIHRMA